MEPEVLVLVHHLLLVVLVEMAQVEFSCTGVGGGATTPFTGEL